ncbi:thylakoid membrane photosystem I accumulation factor [Prochlorococcus sp. MIT 1341]|uniref:thylakoid membrane photosystem I accumulation factor n=1 Tax=Prochlorococcus sp. MIT 1341 TaxID=3096221 RepID=UPI002A75E8B2|nr:thylakoid membrane photosystem I accumulation factor [Prochlorococcus sp. MIT 1341]
MTKLLKTILSILLALIVNVVPAYAARDTNSYDGNIFPIYAGNGSLVPPTNTLSEALDKKRTSVIVYYLDDSADSKAFAPSVSALKLIWSGAIELIPLTTDELQNQPNDDPRKPSYYWHGRIPQVVVIDGQGNVKLDQEGQISLETINEAISEATGLEKPSYSVKIKSFNEYNSEPSVEKEQQ